MNVLYNTSFASATQLLIETIAAKVGKDDPISRETDISFGGNAKPPLIDKIEGQLAD